jgi:hypothetical protein
MPIEMSRIRSKTLDDIDTVYMSSLLDREFRRFYGRVKMEYPGYKYSHIEISNCCHKTGHNKTAQVYHTNSKGSKRCIFYLCNLCLLELYSRK